VVIDAAAPEARGSIAPPAASIRPVPVGRRDEAPRPAKTSMRDVKASIPDAPVVPVRRTGLYAGVAIGALALIGSLAFAFGGSSSSPASPAVSEAAPPAAEPAAPPPAAPAPAPAVAAPEPPAPPPAAVAAPEPPAPPPAAVAAPEPPAAVAAPVRPVVRVVRAAAPTGPTVPRAPRPARAAGEPRAGSPSSPRGAGFVTDNPY
jgi:hypothetical protein